MAVLRLPDLASEDGVRHGYDLACGRRLSEVTTILLEFKIPQGRQCKSLLTKVLTPPSTLNHSSRDKDLDKLSMDLPRSHLSLFYKVIGPLPDISDLVKFQLFQLRHIMLWPLGESSLVVEW